MRLAEHVLSSFGPVSSSSIQRLASKAPWDRSKKSEPARIADDCRGSQARVSPGSLFVPLLQKSPSLVKPSKLRSFEYERHRGGPNLDRQPYRSPVQAWLQPYQSLQPSLVLSCSRPRFSFPCFLRLRRLFLQRSLRSSGFSLANCRHFVFRVFFNVCNVYNASSLAHINAPPAPETRHPLASCSTSPCAAR